MSKKHVGHKEHTKTMEPNPSTEEPSQDGGAVINGEHISANRKSAGLRARLRRLRPNSVPMQALMFAVIFGLLGGGVLLVKNYALTPAQCSNLQKDFKSTSLPITNACKLNNGMLKIALSNGATVTSHGPDPIIPTETTAAPVTADAKGILVQATQDLNPVTATTNSAADITSTGADASASASATPSPVTFTRSVVNSTSGSTGSTTSLRPAGATVTNVNAASTDPGQIYSKPLAPVCATDYYGQLIYAVPAGATASSSGPTNMRTAFEQANGFLHDQSAPYHVDIRYKMLCSGGVPSVTTVHLPNSNPNFGQTTSELAALGYNKPNVKYWVYVQGRGGSDFQSTCGGNSNCYFGIGTMYLDDRLASDNASNGGAPEWAVVFNVPWNYAPSIMMHENGHNQGAVQLSATHSDGNLHCNVSYAIMCYGGTQKYNCKTLAFDCGYDSYFDPAPSSTNYLRTHWNIGSSLNHFISRGTPGTPAAPAVPKIATGDITGDGYAEITGIKPDGTFWYYANNHNTTPSQMFDGSIQIGTGWQNFNHVMLADVDGDKHADILGTKTDGTLWYYHYAPVDATHLYAPGIQIGIGWNIFNQVVAGDVDGDGHADLIGIKPDGTMWYYKYSYQDTTHLYLPGVNIGAGWNIYRQVALADVNGDGHVDVVGLPSDGTLWYYPYGPADSVHPFLPRVQIGTSGWQAFNEIIAGDTTNDGAAEILGVKADGSLWYYANAIKTSTNHLPYSSGVLQGNGWMIYAP